MLPRLQPVSPSRRFSCMKDYCIAISDLWLMLNPHCTVEGCEVDGAGTVRLRLWYRRNSKQQPLEIVLGNPPSQVLKNLRTALNEEARAKRLSLVDSRRVIGEMPGNSKSGQVDGTDK